MSDKDKHTEEEEFGWDNVEKPRDLEAERGVGPGLGKAHRDAKDAKGETMIDPGHAGHYERVGADSGGLGMPLRLGERIKQDGRPVVTEYEAAYNQYAQPLRKTYRAMGRVKDVSQTGAPLTPAELKKNPGLAKKFENITLDKKEDAESQGHLGTWADHQTKMRTNIVRYGSGQHLMAGALAAYSAAQKALEIRKKASVRDSKNAEINEIEANAKRIHEMANVALEAWNVAGELDEVFGSQAFNEDVQGPNVIDPNPTMGETLMDVGTVGDPTGEKAKVGTKGAGRAGKLDAVAQGAKDSKKIIAEAKAKLKEAGHFELNVDDVLTAVMGGQKYVDLKKEVAALEASMKKLGLEKEMDEMTSATENLSGFKMQFSASEQQAKDDRQAARKEAQVFAQGRGAGKEGIMAMYAVEAYQELAAWGELAARERKDIEPMWRGAKAYVNSHRPEHFFAIGVKGDYHNLKENLHDYVEQRDYINQHLPEWQKTAQQWNDFFKEEAHTDLVRQENSADNAERVKRRR